VKTVSLMLSAGVLMSVMLATSAAACGGGSLRMLARDLLAEDAARAEEALAELRSAGPKGLEVVLAVYAEEVARADELARQGDPRWRRIAAAIDKIAGQKDAWASGLYWYTDIEEAKAAARDSGKPILSLRLLGRLDTDLSCANSRFFRTALYANAEVSTALRERFVLHWKSVRPVPVVTIDMGDGRTIRRTITGNSIHYVLDADGRPVDAVPGLYGPAAFLRTLDEAARVERVIRGYRDELRAVELAAWHEGQSEAARRRWAEDLMDLGVDVGSFAEAGVSQAAEPAVDGADATAEVYPTAVEAAPLAIGKSAAEVPLVRAILVDAGTLSDKTTGDASAKIAAIPWHVEDAQLDAGTRRLMAAKFPPAERAGKRAMTKRLLEDPMLRVVANFERSIAEDTVRNEYTFHRQIHDWFAAGLADAADVDVLNEKVYAELFLTPSADPWLGLVPADAYAAIDGDGLEEPGGGEAVQ
jgi:hypothetical protein